ncbi:MAG: purine-nucleoside phosphorylase [Chitinophagaceae bacterium]
MEFMQKKLKETVQFLIGQGFQGPEVGIVLGTGLGQLIDHIQVIKKLPYQDIPDFPVSTVESHPGNLIFGKLGNTPVMAMQGRFHYYEGYSPLEITFPIRVMKELGIRQLLLSNAAGGMNPLFRKGDLVLIEDHINLQSGNPLQGVNDPQMGPRFVDMSEPYDQEMSSRLRNKAAQLGIPLYSGVYIAVTGPNLETRAEYRYLRKLGGDMVGMSTVPEVIVANQIGLPCAAVSVITDECDPDHLQRVNIAEIIAVASQADQKLSALFAAIIQDGPSK